MKLPRATCRKNWNSRGSFHVWGVAPAIEELQHREDELLAEVWIKKVERLKKWRHWVRTSWKHAPRKIFCWLKGGYSGEGAVNLTWNSKEPPTDVGARVERAEKEWGGLWEREQPYQNNTTRGVPLPILTIDELNDVLKRIPQNKVGGGQITGSLRNF